MKPLRAAGVAVIGAMLMASALGCGAQDKAASPGPDLGANAASGGTLDQSPAVADEPKEYKGGSASLAKSYSSLDELWADSEFSVRGVAGSARVEILGEMPFTVTDFLVEASSDPSMVGSTITIRQTGKVDFLVEGLTDLLVEGKEYLLMVYVFRMEPDGPQIGNQYSIAGERAAWVFTGGETAVAIFPDDSEGIPLELSPDQTAQVLAVS